MLDGHTYAIFQQLVLSYNLGPLTLSNGLNDVRILCNSLFSICSFAFVNFVITIAF